MAGGLNLVPNPLILFIQTIIFLLSMFSIKRLILDPYLRVKKQRDESTAGKSDQAKNLVKRNDEASKEISDRVHKAVQQSNQTVESIRRDAGIKRAEILNQAETESKKKVESIRAEINGMLDEEKKKLPEIISNLSKEFKGQLVN